MQTRVSVADGNLEHVAHAWMKIGIFVDFTKFDIDCAPYNQIPETERIKDCL